MYKGVLIEVVLPSFQHDTGKQLASSGTVFKPSFEQYLLEKKSNSVVFAVPLHYSNEGRDPDRNFVQSQVENFTHNLFINSPSCTIIKITDSHFVVSLKNNQSVTDVKANEHVHSLAGDLFQQK